MIKALKKKKVQNCSDVNDKVEEKRKKYLISETIS